LGLENQVSQYIKARLRERQQIGEDIPDWIIDKVDRYLDARFKLKYPDRQPSDVRTSNTDD
jgi:hypothetical protein